MRYLTSFLAVSAAILSTGAAYAEVINESVKLIAKSGEAVDWFGHSVAISGDVVIVGAFRDDTAGGVNAGSVCIYRFDGTNWVEEAQLLASDGAASDYFGRCVAINGDFAIVTAVLDDTPGGGDAGSAYIYHYEGASWVEKTHLFASDGTAGDNFGMYAAISGNVAIVGSYLDDTTAGGVDAGSAYVYRYDGANWVEEAHLFASDGANSDNFGINLTVSGNIAIIGAIFDDTTAGSDAGSAYIYRYDGANWNEEAHIFASDGAAGDRFGTPVVSGDVAIVGATWDDTSGGINAGSAYIYRYNGANWFEEVHLFASNGSADDHFGVPAISGNVAIVGAWQGDSPSDSNSGSAFLYRYNGVSWVEESQLHASDGAMGDRFGISIAISGDVTIVGAYYDDTASGIDVGSAYLFDITPACLADCHQPTDGVVNVTDLLQVLADWGIPGVCDTNGNGTVDVTDLLEILGAWGPCP